MQDRAIKVLYADDETGVRFGRKLMESAGYMPEIDVVDSLDSLVNEALSSHDYDIIFTEYRMSNDDTSFISNDGVEAIGFIRNRDRKTPIILISKYPNVMETADGKKTEVPLESKIRKYDYVRFVKKYPSGMEMRKLLKELLGD